MVAAKDKSVGATFDGSGVERLALRDIISGQAILSGERDSLNHADTLNNTGCPTWKERKIHLHYNEDGTKPPAKVAGELLVPAGNHLVLHTWLSNRDTQWKSEYTVFSLKDKIETEMDGYTVKGLVAGMTYNLNLTVYGPKQISIEVKATPWKEGGDIEVDTEQDQEN